jgi:PelA/Pel-15E family pectate lyase
MKLAITLIMSGLFSQLPLQAQTAQKSETISDESKVAPYTLPDPLICQDGTAVENARQWWEKRRPETLNLFAEQIYGRTLLDRPESLKFVVLEEQKLARGGRATRLRIAALFEGKDTGRKMEILLYLPNDVQKPVPVFCGLNFDGNYTMTGDADLPVPSHWAMGLFGNKLENHRPAESSRGIHAHMMPIDFLLRQGVGIATAAYGEIEPDENGKWREGIRGLAAEPGPGDWGAIGAWAWGLSRMVDYLETNPRVEPKQIVANGFSRLGKAALWAAAQDQRFAGVISNASGAGGIALAKRIYGETNAHLSSRFPWWFAQNFQKYAGKEPEMPVDSHQLAALVAPRPLLITSATADQWSDPKGEFLAGQAAHPVYKLLKSKGFGAESMPKPGKLENDPVGYFIREGGHDVLLEDWEEMAKWAEKHLAFAGLPKEAAQRYERRLETLPAADRTAWLAWFKVSDALRKQQIDDMLSEAHKETDKEPKLEPAPDGGGVKVDEDAASEWYAGAEADALTAAMISYQCPAGGWSKSVDYSKGPRPRGGSWTTGDDSLHYAGTFDNSSTTDQLLFLARRQAAKPDDAVKAAALKGLDYILAAQTPSGGWPQNFPLEGDYHDAITLNDGAMENVLTLLLEAVDTAVNSPWQWLPDAYPAKLRAALDRGLGFLIASQVTIGGRRTIWGGQYDLLTNAVVGGRSYELPALSSSESVNLVRMLMKIQNPDAKLRSAIQDAVEWFRTHEITDPPSPEKRWARFYDPLTEKPFYPGKTDGKKWTNYVEMRKDNPGGYDFHSSKPADLIGKWFAKWKKQNGL